MCELASLDSRVRMYGDLYADRTLSVIRLCKENSMCACMCVCLSIFMPVCLFMPMDACKCV